MKAAVNIDSNGLAFLTSGGAMGRAIAAADWSAHPVGPAAQWPAALRTALAMVLDSGFPSYVAWGPQFHVFYNVAYVPILGNKVGVGQGQPLAALWHEVADLACAIAERAYGGESVYYEDMPFLVRRHAEPEQTYFTFSYSPIRDEAGLVCGVLGTVFETTGKVVALARYRESEARLQLSLDASGNIGTWSVDLETNTTVVDERFARLFQVDAALAQSGTALERFTNMIHPDDRERVNAAISLTMATGAPYEIDYRIPQLSGRIIWVGVKGGIFTSSETGRKRFAGVAVDITERKLADQALRLQAERQAFQLALADRLRPLTRTPEIIAAAASLLGEHIGAARVFYTDVDAERRTFTIRQDWSTATHPSLAGVSGLLDDFGPQMIAAMERGEAAVVDDIFSDPQTAPYTAAYREMSVLSHMSIPLLTGGRLVAVLGIHKAEAYHWTEGDLQLAHDIAERTWSAVYSADLQDVLQRERNQSTGIFDAMAEGFALIDADWTLMQVNEVGAQLAQLARADMIGMNQWEVFPQLDGGPGEDLFRRVQRTREPGTLEYYHSPAGGHSAWIEIRAYAVGEERLALFFRDITERKTNEHELSEGSRRKDEFLAMLAHELRNPLAPIGAAADLLSIASLDQAGVRRTSAVIARQVRHMTSLVDDLLDVSRVTRGLITLDHATLDLRRIVADAVEQVRPLVKSRAHTLVLPQQGEPVYVAGDQKRLVQVLANVLNNAAKYTPEGGNIALELVLDAAHVRINVVDNGIGMLPELQARAFEMFAQAERTSDRAQGGLGLGLALVKSLVELHHGSVSVASDGPGAGSRFSIRLPLASIPKVENTAPAVHLDSAARALRLMIVDDNTDAASMLAMLLEASGHTVMVEHDALSALERVRTAAPDVCLLYIGLPDMDGNELARRLRQEPATAKSLLIAVTGYGQALDRSNSSAAGFDHHLVKPLDTARLSALLSEVRRA